MSSPVKETLKSLCNNYGWSYALLWKFKYLDPMLVMCEDAYYASPEDQLEASNCSSLTTIKPRPSHSFSKDIIEAHVKCETDNEIGSMVDKMLHQVHVVEECLIGHVAHTGKHQWVFQDSSTEKGSLAGYADQQAHFQNVTALSHQFSVGIKTIVVIDVASLGVVQLGSIKKIMENKEFIAHVRSLFLQVNSVQEVLSASAQKASNPTIHAIATQRTSASETPSRISSSKRDCAVPLSFGPFKEIDGKHSITLTQPSNSGIIKPQKGIEHQISSSRVTCTSAHVDIISGYPNMESNMRNLRLNLTSQLPTSKTEAQVIIPYPNLNLLQDMPHFNPNPKMDMVQSASCLASEANCYASLALLEQELRSRMKRQEDVNMFSAITTDSCLSQNPLPNSQAESIPSLSTYGTVGSFDAGNDTCILESDRPYLYPGKHVDAQISSSPFQGIECTGSGNSPKVSEDLRQRSNKPSLSRQNLGNIGSSTWTPGQPEQVGDSSMDSLGNTISQCLGMDSLFGSIESQDQNWLRDMLTQNIPQSSSLTSSHQLKENPKLNAHNSDGVRETSSNGPMLPFGVDELFGTLGCDLRNSSEQARWDNVLLPTAEGNLPNSSNGVSTNFSELDLSIVPENGDFSENRSGDLLEAVVASVSSFSGKSSCTTLTRSGNTSLCSSQVRSSVISRENSMVLGSEGTVFTDWNLGKAKSDIQSTGLSISRVTSWIEDGQSMKKESAIIGQPNKADEPPKVSRKRARPGESTRPRPKDRQQIQDRVKELREIVPNGAKCSIDALLERTIKHMLFLQSVTKHADKLRQASEPKMIGNESGLVLKDYLDGGGGATWAFEVGCQSMVCPIIVEDLNPPRQMLVEMLCEERGFFLEIADIIRGFGLTILKGVMESRNDKIWAHFAVEANRDMTRMEIFLSLVQLLEQAAKGTVSSSLQLPRVIGSGSHLFTSFQSPIPPAITLAERFH
ncbi:hypothetical protein AMTRI_Chr09g22990 [Amborella trichopoda]